jgi:glucosamine--fructose-6-phosphate aminotransferase (isomerizing)
MQYMLAEIMEQPETIRKSLACAHDEIKNLLESIKIEEKRNLWLVGSGSSFYCGKVFSWAVGKLASMIFIPVYSSEISFLNRTCKKDLVFFLSQSGESFDILAATQRTKGLKIAVTNSEDSSLEKMCKFTLHSKAGLERGIPATKSFLGMLSVLILLAIKLGDNRRIGKSSTGEKFNAIPDILAENLNSFSKQTGRVARTLAGKEFCDVIGKGISYPVALEGSLKLREAARIHANAFPLAEYLHGPTTLAGKGYPVIVFLNQTEIDDTSRRILSELERREAFTTIISQNEVATQKDISIQTPTVQDIFSPFFFIPVVQLLAYHTGIEKGLDPDRPAGLTKVVK